MLSLRLPGLLPLRLAARRFLPLLFQEPPRKARFGGDSGEAATPNPHVYPGAHYSDQHLGAHSQTTRSAQKRRRQLRLVQ